LSFATPAKIGNPHTKNAPSNCFDEALG